MTQITANHIYQVSIDALVAALQYLEALLMFQTQSSLFATSQVWLKGGGNSIGPFLLIVLAFVEWVLVISRHQPTLASDTRYWKQQELSDINGNRGGRCVCECHIVEVFSISVSHNFCSLRQESRSGAINNCPGPGNRQEASQVF